VALRDKGITELPLAQLNARLAPHGYVIHARKGQDANHLVKRTGEGERVEQFGLFEIRRMSSAFPSAMHS